MAFHDRLYDAYVMLGRADAPPLWSSAGWMEVARSLDALLLSVEGPAAVRSTQLDGPMGKMKTVAFGRIGWNAKGHDAWTHSDSPGDAPSRLFVSTEVWAPSWTRCEQRDRAPDVFFKVHNPAASGETVMRSPILLLAVASDLDLSTVGLARSSAEATSRVVGAVARAHQRRPWGYSCAGGGFDGSLQDLLPFGAFEPNWRHGSLPAEPHFDAAWSRY